MNTAKEIFRIMDVMQGEMLSAFLNHFTDTIYGDDVVAEVYQMDGKTGRILLQSEKYEMVLELRQVNAETKEKLAPGIHVEV